MKPTLVSILALAALAAAAVGCKKKERYSPGCQRAVSLASPWDGYKLPVEGGRVCASDASRTELQFLSGDRPGYETKFETALVAAGFTKDKCTSQSCAFERADERAVVQVIQAQRWVTVIVRR
jgi:hypothetical protein